MEIIVPAAGLSTRFPEMKPKYLLYDYKGELMIYNAIKPFMENYIIHIGILKEHDEQYNASELLKYELGENINIHILDEPTKGPADTVYQIIKKAINEDWWSARIEAIRREKKKILNELAFFPVIENIFKMKL